MVSALTAAVPVRGGNHVPTGLRLQRTNIQTFHRRSYRAGLSFSFVSGDNLGFERSIAPDLQPPRGRVQVR